MTALRSARSQLRHRKIALLRNTGKIAQERLGAVELVAVAKPVSPMPTDQRAEVAPLTRAFRVGVMVDLDGVALVGLLVDRVLHVVILS